MTKMVENHMVENMKAIDWGLKFYHAVGEIHQAMVETHQVTVEVHQLKFFD